ncbi:hypothetical protein QUA13_17120 [Microcoleus sp. S28C3]|uniref:hypothetical protein n=1 Tax=Microcoleus sp. S28C3 TaxID=3055414 RepID=UPI002FD55647
MTQKTGWQNWTMLLGIGALVLAVSISISGFLGQEPANLQGDLKSDVPIDKIAVFYWAVLFYNHAGIPLTGIILLLVLILMVVPLCEPTQKTKSSTTWATIGLSVLALAIAVSSVFSQLFVNYEHLTSAEFDDYRYNLGLRIAMDNDNFYVIGKCDRFGIRCDCYAVSPLDYLEDADYYNKTSRTPSLERDAKTKIIYIKTKSRTIPISK